jgi:NAD(P)-dependent dehydrogenase (short-subunit alcohol dehydrogenase family)
MMKYSEYQPRPDLLKDRIILITGAGDGIGRAAALSYALHGATVVLHGRIVNSKSFMMKLKLSSVAALQFYPCSCRAPLLVIMNYWSTL